PTASSSIPVADSTPKRRLPRGIVPTRDDLSYQDVLAKAASRESSFAGGDRVLDVDRLVHPREKVYGTISTIISCWCYGWACLLIIGVAIAPFIMAIMWLSAGLHL